MTQTIETPAAGTATTAGARAHAREQHGRTAETMRHVPAASAPAHLLAGLPGVHRVQRSGEQIQVTGGGNLLGVVSAFLHQREITALELRLEQATLNDAFLALTGRSLEDEGNENP